MKYNVRCTKGHDSPSNCLLNKMWKAQKIISHLQTLRRVYGVAVNYHSRPHSSYDVACPPYQKSERGIPTESLQTHLLCAKRCGAACLAFIMAQQCNNDFCELPWYFMLCACDAVTYFIRSRYQELQDILWESCVWTLRDVVHGDTVCARCQCVNLANLFISILYPAQC